MKRIKYISRFAQMMTRDEIHELVERAAAKNQTLDVTGVLMTSGQMFFQVLEGPPEAVDALYRTIADDPRHSHVLLLKSETKVTRRIFPDWSMRVLVLDPEEDSRLAPLRVMLETVHALQGQIEVLSTTLEKALWGELTNLG